MAFAFAVAGILVYFVALMCTHLAAFRTASNIRKQGIQNRPRIMQRHEKRALPFGKCPGIFGRGSRI